MSSDQHLPFQNIKLGTEYFIVPTANPNSILHDPSKPIGLTIEKITNPTVAKQEGVHNMAYPLNETWTSK